MKKTISVLTAISGIAAFLLAVIGTTALGFFMPGYDPLRATISELGERGSPLFLPAAILFIAVGASVIAFAICLALRSGFKKAALAGSVFLTVNGLFDYIGSGLFPIDAGGAFDSPSGQAHFIVSVVGMSAMVLPAFFYWRAFKAEERKTEAKVTLVAAIAIVITAVAFNIAFFTERFVGLAQRCLDYAYFGWMLVIALLAMRRSKTA